MIKIQVIQRKNYRTDVLVDGRFVYESFLHKSKEVDNIKRLIHALQFDAEIVEEEKN